MKCTNTVIIGGGQAGLAMSRCLVERGIDHVVLERGSIGQRWRSERWDSLRLLSPNWMTRLPHYRYQGDDPDGFMTMPEFIRYLEAYAESFQSPVQTDTSVEAVERDDGQLRVVTNQGEWRARNLVIATGFCDQPRVPSFANKISPTVNQIVPSDYRRPSQLPAGNVLIVGASATGAQIAEELSNAGREVTLAVGTHVRLPRRYRGRDILSWMVEMGAFRAPAEPAAERSSPPPQLVGGPNRDLDLGTLQKRGVRLVGHATDAKYDRMFFADDVCETLRKADGQLAELLAKIDAYITANASDAIPDGHGLHPVHCPRSPREVAFEQDHIRTVVWATGYQRSYPWLWLPILDNTTGDVVHRRGITAEPGVVVLGMRFQATKGSNLIDGVGADAEELAEHLATRTTTRWAA